MKQPHKHAALIKAWADGAEIEFFSKGGDGWVLSNSPQWYDDYEYRIKPKPDAVHYLKAVIMDNGLVVKHFFSHDRDLAYDNLKLTFDSETKKLKSAEVL